MIPSVRLCCLTVPDLWNDDRGAPAPHPSVFISHSCPRSTPPTPLSLMLEWTPVVVILMVTDAHGRSPLKSSRPRPQPAGRVPCTGPHRLEVREWWKVLLFRAGEGEHGGRRRDERQKLYQTLASSYSALFPPCPPLKQTMDFWASRAACHVSCHQFILCSAKCII